MNLDYWIGVTECNCHAETPIGGCLHCDLVEHVRSVRELVEAVQSYIRFVCPLRTRDCETWNCKDCASSKVESTSRVRRAIAAIGEGS